MKTLGHVIRDRRKELGMTQDDLANDLSKSQGYVAKIETDAQSPGVRTLNEIAEILEIPKEKLFQYDQRTKPFVAIINQDKDYDERWAKLSTATKNALLEFAPILEKYLE